MSRPRFRGYASAALPLFDGLDGRQPGGKVPAALEEPEVLRLDPCPLGDAPDVLKRFTSSDGVKWCVRF